MKKGRIVVAGTWNLVFCDLKGGKYEKVHK
jgi:hypothetical protein